MATVLIVEDEPKIARVAHDYLVEAGYAVVMAGDGRSGLDAAARSRPDLVLLDLRLPDIDGLDVARRLRQQSAVPIIMVTARAEEPDKLVGLELGADDYVTKPFSPRELVARVRAVLRRWELARAGGDTLRSGELVADLRRREVRRGQRSVELTATEFDLLAALLRSPGRVFTRAQLLDAIHGVAFEAYERAIDAHVKNIRRKLERDPRHPEYLLTVHGVGYKLAER
jgi:two-component system alkaline phosphatase synthesis response regulator PhoP